ncbi:hypothetical protein KI387_044123 [Taxus chinensis]|uniref:Uncharacterized protein n=1 Tax=Taxus chinensis TaxID=29808 RepID=A0AA38CG27_TAXCH|nr:hypothetical protein KI387_044123 [Taxus chinensis]
MGEGSLSSSEVQIAMKLALPVELAKNVVSEGTKAITKFTSGMVEAAQTLPGIFVGCPITHMFELGRFTLLERMGTYVYKGILFAAIGFSAGLAGIALFNGLINVRKKMDPNFETPNKAPSTLLNAFTWALQMGFSTNLRYQTLTGLEFSLTKGLPPIVFKSSVIVLRCLNNVIRGMDFVLLARITGTQKVDEPPPPLEEEKGKVARPS